jgi:hypothetical protein
MSIVAHNLHSPLEISAAICHLAARVAAKVIETDAIPAAIWEIAARMARVPIRSASTPVAIWQIATRLAAKLIKIAQEVIRTAFILDAISRLATRGRLDFATNLCDQWGNTRQLATF